MRSYILILLLVFALPVSAKNCAAYLTTAQDIGLSENKTDNFIAFLAVMHKEHVIGDEYLEKLAKGEIGNPLKNQNNNSEHIIFKDTFQDFVESNLDKNKIAEWANMIRNANTKIHREKEKNKKQTKNSFVKMKFHRIEAGSFSIKRNDKPVNVQLTIPFEMMATSVTQKMWQEVMNGEVFRRDSEPEGLDYPVVYINWWMAIIFANALSKKNKLPPVYDLSAITDWQGDWARGNYYPVDQRQAIKLLKINAPDGDIYKATGYRLPTQAEFSLVLSKIKLTDLQNHAWSKERNLTSPELVAALAPFNIDGNNFFDLYGNVSEWLNDVGTQFPESENYVNPTTNITEIESTNGVLDYRLQKATNYTYSLTEMNKNRITTSLAVIPEKSIGFRLVRSLEK